MRPEEEIFEDLAKLCQAPGYIHALAFLCFRDTVVAFSGDLKASDLARLSSPETLIRTEINTLFGLMMRGDMSFAPPTAATMNAFVQQSDKLLRELHDAISMSGMKDFTPEMLTSPDFNPFASAAALREPIFYAAESAYTFQYRDLAPRKYASDRTWLAEKRGLEIDAAHVVCEALVNLLNDRLTSKVLNLRNQPLEDWTVIPGYTFSCTELASITGIPLETVLKTIEPFCVPGPHCNTTFTSLQAFNAAYAFPIVKRGPDEYILLQAYGYTEALYDAPFYWMISDKKYAATAAGHRGEFAEEFSRERLVRVFGEGRVYQNVEILRGKGETLGEIDVLVIFGDRAVVLQAKSKKLTLGARNGNDLLLKGDFKAAVQDAVDQAFVCASFLGDNSVRLVCRDGMEVELRSRPKTIFPMAIVTDHYPALSFQARQFLQFPPSNAVMPPLVMDVFALDAITEMLSTPLRFLSYVTLRVKSSQAFMTSHENVLLSYHLQNNLWLGSDVDLVMLDDDISTPLDTAMAARRDGIPGPQIPEGLLTKFRGTIYESLVAQIESEAHPTSISLGLALMELGEDSIGTINRNLGIMLQRANKDRQHHDFTLGTDNPRSGITFHVNASGQQESEDRLHFHCRRRKYLQMADLWHGVVLNLNGSIRMAATLSGAWEKDAELDQAIARTESDAIGRANVSLPKLGRNEKCRCGSGQKFKKCCMRA